MSLPQAVDFSHDILQDYVQEGDTVLDATCGNGHDTVYLARMVGDEGKVKAIDIQREAIENTKTRLRRKNLRHVVELIQGDHSELKEYFPAQEFKAAIFNLGYLPGGNKDIITRKDTTLAALNQTRERIPPGGALVVVAYPGHEGGRKECEAVLDWAKNLDPDSHNVLHYHFINQPADPPEVFAVEKR